MSLCPHGINIKHRTCDQCVEIAEAEMRVHERAQPSGCTCQGCGKIYREDVRVPDKVWETIKPEGKPEGGGLLCGNCIVKRILTRPLVADFGPAVLVDPRPCYVCGYRADNHPWELDKVKGLRRGRCPTEIVTIFKESAES